MKIAKELKCPIHPKLIPHPITGKCVRCENEAMFKAIREGK